MLIPKNLPIIVRSRFTMPELKSIPVHIRVFDNADPNFIIACMRSDPKLNGFNVSQQAYVLLVAPALVVRQAVDKEEVRKEAMIHGIRVCFPTDDFLRELLTTGKTNVDSIRRELKIAKIANLGDEVRINVCAQPLRMIAEEEIRGKLANRNFQQAEKANQIEAPVPELVAAKPEVAPVEIEPTARVPLLIRLADGAEGLLATDIKEVWQSDERYSSVELVFDKMLDVDLISRHDPYLGADGGRNEQGERVLIIYRDFSSIGKAPQAIARLYYREDSSAFRMDVSSSHRHRQFTLQLEVLLYTDN